MKRGAIRLAATASISVFMAVTNVTSPASAAAPEFKPASGTFPVAFVGKAGLTILRAGDLTVECSRSKEKGEITGAKSVANLTDTYEECEGKAGSEAKCALANIVTKALKGTLGKLAGGKVGEKLTPASGTELFKIPQPAGKCIPATVVTGGVVAEFTQLSERVSSLLLTETSEKQTYRQLEGEEEVETELRAFSAPARLVVSTEKTYEQAVEVT